jgi:hypothetical protein
MPMTYPAVAIPESEVPAATDVTLQHLIDTYASETNKVFSIWTSFDPADLEFRPHPKSSTVAEIMRHQLLSERRFFGEFLGTPEPPAEEVLPPSATPPAFSSRLLALARPRLGFLATRPVSWWYERVPFFDVERERIWIFWRRVLHTSHHRTQLTVYQRLLDQPVLPTYGPTADVSWEGADPTLTVEAASRS